MPDLHALYVQHPFWSWVALAGVLLALEAATGSGWLLWPAATAIIVALLATYAGLDLAQATLIFALLTIGLTVLSRRFFPKSLLHSQSQDINDNVARLVGHQGRVVSTFEGRSGRVFIDGKEWAAELDEGEGLEGGARVEVTGVNGAHLRVRSA